MKMPCSNKGLSWREALVILALAGTVLVLLLPALSRARESARRASCQNNLKQMGLVFKMFANESRGGVYPPMSPTPFNLVPDMDRLYPEYLSDLNLLVCPTTAPPGVQPFTLQGSLEHPATALGHQHPDCVTGQFYTYTGYALFRDEHALAFTPVLYDAWAATSQHPITLGNNLDLRIPVLESPDIVVGDWNRNGWPILWDRVPSNPSHLAHLPGGGNVLYWDGRVEFLRYSHYNGESMFPITPMVGDLFGDIYPTLSLDCYSG